MMADTANGPGANKARELEAIRQMEADMSKAIARLDIPEVMTHYVDNDSLVLFDQMTPRQYNGRQAMIDIWNDFLENKVKSLDSYSSSEPTMWVSEAGDLAGGFLFHSSDLTMLDGTQMSVVLRVTHVLVKQNGRWVVQHEHGSFPINWETGEVDYLSKE
ncbi:YybH family protein [Aurantiacibacter rhizosphaerae]|uniref:SnoaL-like domain-containing protein n=1 Tax=Aurantiacibacter rhizosphaerae TaxID=2691582 RepID=A0A844XDU7_9SPHN|nr:nuclear transport factor 2 family protein [Aurantiacibacter rhizosphaerae]MWV27768.1 hypothetical protein [Aurantiacibacter rhizosphaerae]